MVVKEWRACAGTGRHQHAGLCRRGLSKTHHALVQGHAALPHCAHRLTRGGSPQGALRNCDMHLTDSSVDRLLMAWAQCRRIGVVLLRLGPPRLMSMEGEDIKMFQGRPQAVKNSYCLGLTSRAPSGGW